ncbi:MAG: FecR family protein [Chloroflexota bacterium]|nr:FecR family protein [Chloroflexota bacterium]
MLHVPVRRDRLPWIDAWRKASRSRTVVIVTTLAFVLATTGAIALLVASPAQAHSSTVTVLDGQVLVRHGNGLYVPITDGDAVGTGDSVHTAAGSHGVLTLFDGTTIELEPDTELSIDRLLASATGDKVVVISQVLGRTWNVVTHLVSQNSRYEIKTPASTAAVRGTAFEVVVFADGSTMTATTEGDVATSAQGREVHVLAGQVASVTQGSPPSVPRPAPEPATTVRVTVDLTQNAIVTDASGRAVGVQNGLPVRYIPGSTVETVDGKLVITIPNPSLGLLSTFVRPDAPSLGERSPSSVTVQTQVIVKDAGIVADDRTSRPVQNGTAKGAVVVTDGGLLLVPDGDAPSAPAPHIGKLPPGPTGMLPAVAAGTVQPLAAVASATASIVPTAPSSTAVATGVVTATAAPTATVQTPLPTPTPAPTSGGFVPSTIGLVPTLPTPSPTPTPTLAPVLRTIDPIIAIATPTPSPAPSPTATATPLLKTLDPTIVPTATPTAVPTTSPASPTPTPTPAPTQAPLICLPLVGCL